MTETIIPLTPTADVILVNGRVITVNSRDEVVDAIALAGNRILRVGARPYVEQTMGRHTRVIDLCGRAVVPGIVDNHAHFASSTSRHWVSVTFEECATIDEICAKISDRAAITPPGEWILARGYQANRLRERRNPNRYDLDSVTAVHPVGISNRESMGWTFNTLGLRRVGVQDDTPDPPGGPMERDERGVPLGPMWDNTRTAFVLPNLPQVTLQDLVDGFRWLSGELNRYGITRVFEAALRTPKESRAFQELQSSSPKIRIVLGPYPLYGDQWEADTAAAKLFDSGFSTGFGNDWLKVGALQTGVDGGVIGQGAALFEPYSNDPEGRYRGNFRITQVVANEFVSRAQASGWQVAIVCHGDHGTARSLEAVAASLQGESNHLHRHRLEHAYLWTPRLMDKMAQLGVIWNTQPAYMQVLGPQGTIEPWGERARYAFPFRSLYERGVIITAGSDYRGGIHNPFVGLDVLVNHRFGPLDNSESLNPDERLTVLEALRVYTYNGAYTSFDEHRSGSLEEGKLADLAVLSRDILRIPTTEIRNLEVDLTFTDGKIVYQRLDNCK